MISDVLFEALNEIERYERDMPEVYAPVSDKINHVKEAMRDLQRDLDTPPAR